MEYRFNEDSGTLRWRLHPYSFSSKTTPKEQSQKKSREEIRQLAKERFESWRVDGRIGIDIIRDLFPTYQEYLRMQRLVPNFPGDFPQNRSSIRRV